MDIDVPNGHRRRRIPRFGIGILLALTACIACYLAGRRDGFEYARRMWIELPSIQRIYNVNDLISKRIPDEKRFSTSELIELLQSEIRIAGISENAADYSVHAGPTAGSIAIGGNQIAHVKTEAVLEGLRVSRK